MFEGIKFVVQFIVSMIEHTIQLITIFSDGVATLTLAAGLAPSFLGPIIFLTLSIAVVMWVVNLL